MMDNKHPKDGKPKLHNFVNLHSFSKIDSQCNIIQ